MTDIKFSSDVQVELIRHMAHFAELMPLTHAAFIENGRVAP